MPATNVAQERVKAIYERETKRFHRDRPKSAALLNRAKRHMPNGVPCAWMEGLYFHQPIFAKRGEGAYFWDADDHKYLDMNQADLSMTCGYGPKALVEVMQQRVADGSQFLLPVEDSIEVSAELANRYRLPYWQFTLSASSANMEAIRIARAFAGKEYILVFNGNYHGHIDDTMGYQNSGDDSLGFTKDFSKKTINVDFNDLAAVESALKDHPIACVLTEPALTNIGVIKPEEGFFDALRKLCDQYQSLLIIDETHTQICAWGGLSRAWNIQCDMLTLGKTVAAGIPTGTYGMTKEIGEFVASHLEAEDELDSRSMNGGLAIGGTLYGNALCMAATKVALNEILTPEAYEKSHILGNRLSTGLQRLFDKYGLTWLAQHLMGRSGYTFGPEQPSNASQFGRYSDPFLYNAMRAYYANRGVWEAISSAGPTVSFVMEASDIDFYLERVDEFLNELTSSNNTV